MFDEDEEELELLRQYEDKDLIEDEDNRSSDEIDSDLEDKIMSMVQYDTGIAKKKAPLPKTQHDNNSDIATTAATGSVVNDEDKDEEDDEDKDEDDAQNIKRKNTQATIVYAPMNIKIEDGERAEFSLANEYHIDETDSDDDIDFKSAHSNEESSEDEEEVEKGDVDIPELTADVPIKKNVELPQVTRFINLEDEDRRYEEDEETSEEEAMLNIKLQKLIDDQIYNRQSKSRFMEKSVRVCFSCRQPGHERINCKICPDCGGPKHKESRCTGARYCSRCKYRGHNAIDCENARTTEDCRRCYANYHHTDVCPSLLHTYVGEVPPKTTPVAWCYNCTARGHYGDECPVLPQYKLALPSAFSILSLGLGSRFDPKKGKKGSSYQKHGGGGHATSKHQRWSDSSRESSPRHEHYPDKKRARHSYKNDNHDDDYSSRHGRGNQKRDANKKKSNDNSQGLSNFFSHQQPSSKNKQNSNNNRSGNSNWKAMNNDSLPQPTRSGTVNVKSYSSHNRQQRQDYGDFPRGNNSNNLPKPSSSGVIDLTSTSTNNNNNSIGGNEYASRKPKYHGGYSRNR